MSFPPLGAWRTVIGRILVHPCCCQRKSVVLVMASNNYGLTAGQWDKDQPVERGLPDGELQAAVGDDTQEAV